MNGQSVSRASVLRESNFRWLIGGGMVSGLGDQFTLIALPWLVLTMTGSALTMGLVIALMSVPRALFILVGGALVDRYSPKLILMLSKHLNAALLLVLALMVLSGSVSLPAVYLLAFAMGLASAFSIPSGTSILPHVVAPDKLPLANGILMGVRQLTMLSGPLLAALIFALFGDGSGGGPDAARGIGIAFAIDCFSFVFSAWTLSHVKLLHAPAKATAEPVFKAIGAGVAAVWSDTSLRVCMLYWALGALVVGGTMQVALPVFASERLGGASALGLIMGTHGTGALLGMALTGVLKRFSLRTFGATLLMVDAIIGVLLIGMSQTAVVWQAASFMLLIGLFGGYMQVAVFSWIQQRVPRPMLGRAMSLLMFIFMGVAPLAAAITGWLLHLVTLNELFVGAGAFLALAAALAWLLTPMPAITDGPAQAV